MNPRRELGQHFLIDPAVAEAIVAAAAPKPTESVEEIGPGKGALTALLAPRCRELTAIEIDPALARALRGQCLDRVRVVEGDALRLLPSAPCDLLISNTPYAIAEALIRLLPVLRFNRCLLALPEPFIDILLAPLGSPDATALTLFFQSFFTGARVAPFPAAATDPPAPHDGSVLAIRSRPAADAAEQLLREIIRVPARRLKNALRESTILVGICKTKREGRAIATELLRATPSLADSAIQSLQLPDLLRIRESVAQHITSRAGNPQEKGPEKPF